MEYGSAYLRASRPADDDSVSMLPTEPQNQSQYQAYRPDAHRNSSSEDSTYRTPSWLVSPVEDSQQPPSLEQPTVAPSPSPGLRPSIFGTGANPESPYQEQVAWANSTHFRPSTQEGPKPATLQTSFVITEDNLQREARRYFRHPRHILEPWNTGFWVRFPWCGFGAIFLILMLTGASTGILLASHGMSMADWMLGNDNAQPNVYISVFEMVMNFLILFALANGMVIRFWRQLLHGTTLTSVHDTYESIHLWPAVKRVVQLKVNSVALACVLAVFSFIRGPLFQRALTLSDNGTTNTQGTVNLQVAPYPMIEYFQQHGSDPRMKGGITTAFSELLRDLSAGFPMAYNPLTQDCGQYCTGTAKGVTFKTDCTSTTEPFDLSALPDECKTCTDTQCTNRCMDRQQSDFNPTFFSIGYSQDANSLKLTSRHKDTSSCKGNINVQTCTLTQVNGDYPIVITNGTIDRTSGQIQVHDEQVSVDELLMKKFWPLAFETLFPLLTINVRPASDYSKLEYNKCVQPRVVRDADGSPQPGPISCSNSTTLEPALVAIDPSTVFATQSKASADADALCSLTWRDPMPDMLNKMQSLILRVMVDMATSDGSVFAPNFTGDGLADLRKDWHQSVSVSGHQIGPLYHTNRVLVTFGVLLSIIGVAAIVPLYNGFWELGRDVSLNPLEVARAFGAPMMEGLDGNATPDMVTIERGGMSVKYGALERFGDGKRLRIEESARATVRTPWQGEIFG